MNDSLLSLMIGVLGASLLLIANGVYQEYCERREQRRLNHLKWDSK